MEFVYALINFLLLVGLVFLLGRKKVTAMFRERRERINGGLDLAEAVDRMPAEPPEEEPLAIVEPERAPEAELTGPIRAAVREHAYRLKAQYDHSCEDMRRVMLLDVRDEVVRRAQKLAAQRMTEEPYRSVLRSHEAEMVDSVLDDICLYNDFSLLNKRVAGFNDSLENVTGCSLAIGKVFTYIDYAVGRNHAWLGDVWDEAFAGGTEDNWNVRFNINIGYYF